ncbi:DUF447 domain-containing protein [Halobacteriales archaeon QS_1_68_20]|nr:MAG: DUF447 domain-containing protein [Halobacteriales archaeon QS_1_68_20]
MTGESEPAEWPVDLRGVTETVTTTLGPNGRWNAAALGVHAGDPVSARTWGNTRTRRNFSRQGEGYVQFTVDPLLFVEAAVGIEEREEPVLDEADAWVHVTADRIRTGESGGTDWAEWALRPVDAAVVRERVPSINRGFGAVVEATVAASRLGVASYDRTELEAQLDYFADVVDRCGGERERAAFDRLVELSEWDGAD